MNAGPISVAYRFDRFTLDIARGALLGPDGAEIPLRPKSMALLRLLVEHAGQAVDRDRDPGGGPAAPGACAKRLPSGIIPP